MTDIKTDEVIDALNYAHHPFSSFSMTSEKEVGNEKHWNFHGKHTPMNGDGEVESKAFDSYTVIVNQESGNVFIKHTASDINGNVDKANADKLVGTFESVAAFEKAISEELSNAVKNLEPSAVYNKLHNIESFQGEGHNMPNPQQAEASKERTQ